MSIPVIGTGGLFTRLGKIIDWLDKVNTNRSTQAGTEVADIASQYQSSRSEIISDIYTQAERYRRGQDALARYLQSISGQTLITMAFDDIGIQPLNVTVAMTELIRQMVINSDSVNAPAVGSSLTVGPVNIGTGTVVVGVNGVDGVQRDYLFNEEIFLRCANDAALGTATVGQEGFRASGEAAVTNPLSEQYPVGSAAKAILTSVDAATDLTSNLLFNGSFDNYAVANTPDNWTIDVGVAGTDITAAGSPAAYVNGKNAVGIVGDGSTMSKISQNFNSNTGSTTILTPSTVYQLAFHTKVSSVPSGGVLRVSLQSAANAVLTDDAGSNLEVSVTLSGETTAYATHTATFITPKALPASYKLVVELTTALDNGVTVYVDHLGFAAATELYTGGPWATIFSGNVAWVQGDYDIVNVTNDYGGLFQFAFERIFGMRNLGLQLPHNTSGGETIVDGLIS